jgi:hypothetical protein
MILVRFELEFHAGAEAVKMAAAIFASREDIPSFGDRIILPSS